MGVRQRVLAVHGLSAAVVCLALVSVTTATAGANVRRDLVRPALLSGGLAAVPFSIRPYDHASAPRDRTAIVGGTAASEKQFGFMALVVYQAASGYYLCSGTMVAPNVVLTAGHCAVDGTNSALNVAAQYRVVTGSAEPPSGAVVSDVSDVVPAPSYDPRTATSDAALLVLSSPVSTPTVRLATPSDARLERTGLDAIVAGWGEHFKGSQPSQHLEWAHTAIQSPRYCRQSAFGTVFFTFHPAIQLCTVNYPDGDTATCNGDSGGPLLTAGPGGQPVEVGITDLAPYDCDTVLADYYTSVAPLVGWIQQEIHAVSASTGSPSHTRLPRVRPHASRLPRMTRFDAAHYTAMTLAALLHKHSFRLASDQARCVGVAWPLVRCNVRFAEGRRFYFGQVEVYWVRATRTRIDWNSLHAIHWVRLSCYRSRHRRACTIHTETGF